MSGIASPTYTLGHTSLAREIRRALTGGLLVGVLVTPGAVGLAELPVEEPLVVALAARLVVAGVAVPELVGDSSNASSDGSNMSS